MQIKTIEDLRKNNLIIFEAISGSKAYGLDTPESDTDIKGIFVLPKQVYYGLDYIEQISNSSNDIVFYELSRFMQLLAVNNPNILEMLNTPKEAIIYKHKAFLQLDEEKILSKLCEKTFGRYAMMQIKKARGLNKKILNPIAKKHKTPMDFCYVSVENSSECLTDFLQKKGINQADCGLSKIANMRETYALFYSKDKKYNGIIKNQQASNIRLSSIEKGEKPMALVSFNKDGFVKYCKDYKEYWNWVENRNQIRYEKTCSSNKNYDAKNIMHVFRLLEMALDIAEQKKVIVKRSNRNFLLSIKSGKFDYEELLNLAEQTNQRMQQAFTKSNLIEEPDRDYINTMTYKIRQQFYADICS